jgi:hypothetical protein
VDPAPRAWSAKKFHDAVDDGVWEIFGVPGRWRHRTPGIFGIERRRHITSHSPDRLCRFVRAFRRPQ